MSRPTTTFDFPVEPSRFRRAMETPDDIGAMIRVHYELDRALQHVVESMIPAPKHLKQQYMSQRIGSLLALGMPELRVKPASLVNQVRNDFAHREKEAFVVADVKALHTALETAYGRPIPDTFRMEFHSKSDGTTRSWVYGEMTLKEKFCFLGSLALGAVVTIPNDFDKASFKLKPLRI